MPNVNLIALRRAEKKKLESITRQLFLALATLVSVLILLITFFLGRHELRVGEIADARKKLAKIQPELDKIAEMEKATAELQPKVDTLEDAKAKTERYRNLFQVVSQSMPPSTWLSSLSSSGDANDASILMNGMASSQSLVGDTMTRLQQLPLFDKVELHQTNVASPEGGVERVNFEVTAHLRPLAPPAPPPGTPAAPGAPPAPGSPSGQPAGGQKTALLSHGMRPIPTQGGKNGRG